MHRLSAAYASYGGDSANAAVGRGPEEYSAALGDEVREAER